MAEIASEILRTRERIARLDRRLEELLADDLAARIVRTMPGMGIVFGRVPRGGRLPRKVRLGRLLGRRRGGAPVMRASGATSYRRRAGNVATRS